MPEARRVMPVCSLQQPYRWQEALRYYAQINFCPECPRHSDFFKTGFNLFGNQPVNGRVKLRMFAFTEWYAGGFNNSADLFLDCIPHITVEIRCAAARGGITIRKSVFP